jgi:hypothetical protein
MYTRPACPEGRRGGGEAEQRRAKRRCTSSREEAEEVLTPRGRVAKAGPSGVLAATPSRSSRGGVIVRIAFDQSRRLSQSPHGLRVLGPNHVAHAEIERRRDGAAAAAALDRARRLAVPQRGRQIKRVAVGGGRWR